MITGIHLTIILFIILITFFVIDFYFMFQYDGNRNSSGKGWEWTYTVFAISIASILFLQPVFLPKLGFYSNSLIGILSQVIGIVCVVVAFAIHIWSRIHLRHYYTERIEIQEEHQAILTGPYAYVRHPFITSLFLITGGMLFLNPAITTLLVFIYTIIDFTSTAKKEEELLSQNVSGYINYMKKVPRFFPRLGIKS